jgi:uncharacterized protein YhaN
MRISRIQIDRYGLWRNLDLPLDPSGISVIYGPNEAGKSTLLNFIRGVLYGFPASETHGHSRENALLGGTLHVLHQDRLLEISRRRGDRPLHQLNVTGWDGARPAEDVLAELTAGTTRRTFQNLFALGLPELQQLAALRSSEVAERMYGATLGTDGKRLLAAIREGETARGSLFDAGGRTGSLDGLMDRDAELAAEIRSLGSQRDEYDRLCRERRRLSDAIDELKSRQAGMQSQLRGHRFMQRVWDPWSQVRDCERELAEVPAIAAFPPDGLQRLRQLEAEIDSETRCRRTLLQEVADFEARRRTLLPDPAALKSIAVLRRFADRRERIEQHVAERDAARRALAAEHEAFDEATRTLGASGSLDGNWDRDRLEAVDSAPEIQHELMRAAGGFQKAVVRRGRFRKAYKGASQSFRKLRAKVEQGSARFGDQTMPDELEWERLQRRAALLRERQSELLRILQRDERRELVPTWFRRVLWFFAVAGGLVALAGLLTAFTVNAWSGLVLCLAGLTGLGASWGLRLQTQSSVRETDAARRAELQEIEEELRNSIRRTDWQSVLRSDADAAEVSEKPAAERIAALVALEEHHRLRHRLGRRRRRMTQLRGRFARVKQDFNLARQNWCDAQKRAGLDVTLKLDDAFAHWQCVIEARERLIHLQAAERRGGRAERRFQRLMATMQRVAGRMQLEPADADDPLRILDGWQRRLEELESIRDETRRIREEIRRRRREAAHYGRSLKILKRRLDALLVQGGAADREEFECRAEAVSRRAELEELLAMAGDELASVAAEEPELAVVEEDLAAYDAAEHAECIRALELELSDLSRDLQRAYEEWGSVKQALSKLADDDRGTRLRIERSRLEATIVSQLEAWLAEHVVARTLDVVKSRFERTHQPAVLASASEFLRRFTRGRYQRIWSPLGRCRLFVEDRWDDSWDLDELSGGAREQLFLALRLALVEDFSRGGVELPLILDDVLVNFDRPRTEAAVDTLQLVAAAGRQILFLTCHEHVADAFRRIGVTPLELPDQHRGLERRIAG